MANEKCAVSAGIALVSLRWNGEPLAARVARAGEPVTLGDARGALAQLPADVLGCAAWTIADADGGPHVRVPEGKVASIHGPAGLRLVAGPERVALAQGDEARLVFGAFDVEIAACEREVAKPRRRVTAGAWVHTAVVAAVHAALLFAGHRSAFASQLEEEATPDLERLRGFLAAAEERSATPDQMISDGTGKADAKLANGENGNGKNGGGERHEGVEGKAGATTSRATGKHFSAARQEQQGNDAPRADDLDAARTFGMIGVLQAQDTAGLRRTDGLSPWGASDPFAAAGGMLGRVAGEAEGAFALALTGVGEGGGGSGQGIGLDRLGIVGHTRGRPGPGTGGAGSPAGIGIGMIGTWSHDWASVSRTPSIRYSQQYVCLDGVTGRLPPEAVQRVVRQNFGRFRACYENGLKRNPSLSGRVTTSFVIARDGAVSTAMDGGSDLPDEQVKSCVVHAFAGLSFPQPDNGIVTVTYPIVFSKTE